MTTATVSLFFALLALAALAGALVLGVVLVAGRVGREWAVAARHELQPAIVPVAALVALVSTLGSLYYSEVAHFVPCQLCWYQRIAMYPLVVVLGIAALRRDHSVRIYVLVPCLLGAAIALYHSFIQAFPPEGGSSFCTSEAPCTERYVWEFGFVSIPFMALCGFLFIATLMVAIVPSRRHRQGAAT